VSGRTSPIGQTSSCGRRRTSLNYLLKGKQIYLEGRIETRSYEDKEKPEEVHHRSGLRRQQPGASRWRQPRRRRSGGDPDRVVSMTRAGARPQSAPSAPDDMSQGITDDDVPF